MARTLIADGRGHDVFPESEEELVAELRRFDAQFRAEGEPRVAVIYADWRAEVTPQLSVGLGADDAALAYDDGDASARSLGRHRDDASEIEYEWGTGTVEFLGWSRISLEDAITAAREFFRTERRPTTVDWVDD
jgi:hypothetical protein